MAEVIGKEHKILIYFDYLPAAVAPRNIEKFALANIFHRKGRLKHLQHLFMSWAQVRGFFFAKIDPKLSSCWGHVGLKR